MKFLKPSWEEIEGMCKKLSIKIKKDYEPEVLVGIVRGGLVPLRLFSDFLDNKNVSTIKIEYYTGIGKTKETPEITQKLTTDIKEKKILVVDDVSDSGHSLKKALEHLKELNPKEIKTVTLHYKPKSIVKPDYFAEETDAWIIYPWEKNEANREKGEKK